MVKRRYDYRLYPTEPQRHAFARLFGCVRFVHNWAVHRRRDMYRRGGEYITNKQMTDDLALMKNTDPSVAFLNEVSAVPVQNEVRNVNKSYDDYFASLNGKRKGPKLGRPRYMSKRGRQSALFGRNARFRVTHEEGARDGWLRLPYVGQVRMRWTRDMPSDASSVTVLLEPDGSYHASFVVEESYDATGITVPEPVAALCGIDLGLVDVVTLVDSNGDRWKSGNPRFLRQAENKVARLQRELARKVKGSKRYEQARLRLARAYAHLRRSRLAWLDGLAERITDENQAVALETLNIRGLARTRVGKSVLDAGWGILIRLIEQKALKKGRTVIRIGRWEPTSQMCSVCGRRTGRKTLDIREWTCPYCGCRLDRDWNAAVNIMTVAAGPADDHKRPSRGRKTGPDTTCRPAFPGEAATPSSKPLHQGARTGNPQP